MSQRGALVASPRVPMVVCPKGVLVVSPKVSVVVCPREVPWWHLHRYTT